MGGAGSPPGEDCSAVVSSAGADPVSTGAESASDSVVVRTTTRIAVRRAARRLKPGDVTVL
jgi:hypothetical protein